ncbi:MAG: hypothetical protein BWK79_12390 [Beggiatoa sp. IS2]|nr:MAG: hypothetical protein BWK79_12390 [Beggiatoa sp. IS2]
MAEFATLARPYANAVFELAKASGEFDQWFADLNFLSTVVQDSTMKSVIANHRVDKAALTRIMLDICDTQVSDTAKNLVKLLMDNGKLRVLPQIATQYEKLQADHRGYAKVEIISAYPVNPLQQAEIETALQRRLSKAVEITISIDASLMGGWLIRTGDQVIDLSVRGRLQQLANLCEIACIRA